MIERWLKLSIKGIARGLFASIAVLAVFAVIDDFVQTLASDLTYNTDLRWAFRATLVWFCAGFVGAYFARQRVELIAVALVLVYWVVIAVYRFSTMSSLTDVTFIEFVSDGLWSIVPSFVACWLGALLGWKYFIGANEPDTKLTLRKRTSIVAVVSFLVLVVAPTGYSLYWNAQAVEQVRIAVRAIESGATPENVYPFKDDFGGYDSTPYVLNLVEELTPETQFIADYKIGDGYHGYEVEIRPESGTKYSATADYSSYGGWMIHCCFRHD